MNTKQNKVYVGMSADIIHHGYINIIKEASKHGNVIIGLLTDNAISTYKQLPVMDFESRKEIISNVKHVTEVVKRDSLEYTENLLKIKPYFVVHCDDWKEGVQKDTREKIINTLSQYGGELIEIPYTKGISSADIKTLMQ